MAGKKVGVKKKATNGGKPRGFPPATEKKFPAAKGKSKPKAPMNPNAGGMY